MEGLQGSCIDESCPASTRIVLAQSEERQDRKDDYDCSDEPNDVVHDGVLLTKEWTLWQPSRWVFVPLQSLSLPLSDPPCLRSFSVPRRRFPPTMTGARMD